MSLPCPACSGRGEVIGSLESLMWFCCRACGWWYPVRIEEVADDQDA